MSTLAGLFVLCVILALAHVHPFVLLGIGGVIVTLTVLAEFKKEKGAER